MAVEIPQLGNGAAITFKGGTGADVIGNIISFNWSGISRPSTFAPHMGSTAGAKRLFTAYYDPGSLECTFQLDAGVEWAEVVVNAAETIIITFNDTSLYSCSGAATEFGFSADLDGVIEGTVTLEFSDSITITGG